MLPKVEKRLHDNHPCCGCGPHCLSECPNYYEYIHPQWNHCVYCSYLQTDLMYYDGGMLAKCHEGFTDEEMKIFLEDKLREDEEDYEDYKKEILTTK